MQDFMQFMSLRSRIKSDRLLDVPSGHIERISIKLLRPLHAGTENYKIKNPDYFNVSI